MDGCVNHFRGNKAERGELSQQQPQDPLESYSRGSYNMYVLSLHEPRGQMHLGGRFVILLSYLFQFILFSSAP